MAIKMYPAKIVPPVLAWSFKARRQKGQNLAAKQICVDISSPQLPFLPSGLSAPRQHKPGQFVFFGAARLVTLG